jgi:hypothetical protein
LLLLLLLLLGWRNAGRELLDRGIGWLIVDTRRELGGLRGILLLGREYEIGAQVERNASHGG